MKTQVNKSYLYSSMLKKCVIFLFLATAYSIMLAHNFTPHQHDTKQTTHHHGHDHHDHDDHDGGHEKKSFQYFQHISHAGVEYTSGQFIKYDVQKRVYESVVLKLACIYVSQFKKPPLIVPLARTEALSSPQTLPYFFQLKAPPAFTA